MDGWLNKYRNIIQEAADHVQCDTTNPVKLCHLHNCGLLLR